jgi:hypothetical protein
MSRRIVAGLFMTLDGSVHEPGEWSFPFAVRYQRAAS